METTQEQPNKEETKQNPRSTSMKDFEKTISALTNAVNRQGVKISRLERQIAKLAGQKSTAKTSSSQLSKQYSSPMVRVRASKLADFLDNVLIQAQKANNQQILPNLRFGAAEKFGKRPSSAKSGRKKPTNSQKAYSQILRAQIADWDAWNQGSARNFLRNYRAPVFKHPNKMIQHNRNDLAKSYARQTRLAGWYQEHENKKGLKRANRLRARYAKKLTRADANFMQRKHADDEIIRMAGAKDGKGVLTASTKQKITQNRNATAALEDLFTQIFLAQLEKLAKSAGKNSKVAAQKSKDHTLRAVFNDKERKEGKEDEGKRKKRQRSTGKAKKGATGYDYESKDAKDHETVQRSRKTRKTPQKSTTGADINKIQHQVSDITAERAGDKAALAELAKAVGELATQLTNLVQQASGVVDTVNNATKITLQAVKLLKKQTENCRKEIQRLWQEVDA